MTSGAGNPGALQVAPFDLYQLDLTVFVGRPFWFRRSTPRVSARCAR